MKAKAVRFAAGLALIAVGAPFPARSQFIYPPVLVVPPPATDYGTPKPKPPPDRPKRADAPGQAKPAGHYEGRVWVPD